MAALRPGTAQDLAHSALPFRRPWDRAQQETWLPEEFEHRFPAMDAAAADALYHRLADRLESFDLLPGAKRQGQALELPLRLGPFSFVLLGEIRSEFLSAEMNEMQRHLHARFELPGGWALHWHVAVCQKLLNGRVRLLSGTHVEPGERRSFRHIIAARALRRALAQSLKSFS